MFCAWGNNGQGGKDSCLGDSGWILFAPKNLIVRPYTILAIWSYK